MPRINPARVARATRNIRRDTAQPRLALAIFAIVLAMADRTTGALPLNRVALREALAAALPRPPGLPEVSRALSDLQRLDLVASDRDPVDQRRRRYRLRVDTLCQDGSGPLADNRHVAPRQLVPGPELVVDAADGGDSEQPEGEG